MAGRSRAAATAAACWAAPRAMILSLARKSHPAISLNTSFEHDVMNRLADGEQQSPRKLPQGAVRSKNVPDAERDVTTALLRATADGER